MPCPVRLANTNVCANTRIDVNADASSFRGSIHAHVHNGLYVSTANSTDASSDDGTAVSLDARMGRNFDTFIAPSPALP